MKISNSSLHYFIMQHIIDVGYAPKISDISNHYAVSSKTVVTVLNELQNNHVVVLHPKTSEVWVIHPFSNAPTNFWIESNRGSWWGNCAWCSLGAAALINENLTITTTLGAEAKQVVIGVKDGIVQNNNLYIHFPVPMVEAWNNVIFTCSTMLFYESESEIDLWCERHGMNKGDVQPIRKIWDFSKVWYGNHLHPDWVKWTVDEAKQIFKRFGLVSDIWAMPDGASRF